MIFHGSAYNLVNSHHPAAAGIPLRLDGSGANVLFDLPEKHGGQDGSFLFQNVNGKCKRSYQPSTHLSYPDGRRGEPRLVLSLHHLQPGRFLEAKLDGTLLCWVFLSTTASARNTFYLDLSGQADVYYTWDDIKNSSRNLVVYSGNVLDLDLLHWFDDTQVTYPSRFNELRDKSTPETRLFEAAISLGPSKRPVIRPRLSALKS